MRFRETEQKSIISLYNGTFRAIYIIGLMVSVAEKRLIAEYLLPQDIFVTKPRKYIYTHKNVHSNNCISTSIRTLFERRLLTEKSIQLEQCAF